MPRALCIPPPGKAPDRNMCPSDAGLFSSRAVYSHCQVCTCARARRRAEIAIIARFIPDVDVVPFTGKFAIARIFTTAQQLASESMTAVTATTAVATTESSCHGSGMIMRSEARNPKSK